MTTVAYRAGVIAADTGASVGELRVGIMSKIARSSAGALAGASGSAGYCGEFLRWFSAGAKWDDLPSARQSDDTIDRAIIVQPQAPRLIRVFEPEGWYDLACEYYALGSGREIALGVFWKGGDPQEALAACLAHDGPTFGSVEVLRF